VTNAFQSVSAWPDVGAPPSGQDHDGQSDSTNIGVTPRAAMVETSVSTPLNDSVPCVAATEA
jgi:hypothetical protein